MFEHHQDLSFEEAFAIGQRVGNRCPAAGCRQIGWKLANSRVGTRAALSHPVKGPSFDRNLHSEADPLSLHGLIAPKIEPEICFLLDRDLAGPGVTYHRFWSLPVAAYRATKSSMRVRAGMATCATLSPTTLPTPRSS